MMMLEKNSDDIIKFTVDWLKKNTAAVGNELGGSTRTGTVRQLEGEVFYA